MTARQGDVNSRYIRILPMWNGSRMDIVTGITASAEYLNSNNKGDMADCQIVDGKIIVSLTPIILATPGMVTIMVILQKNGSRLSSQDIIIEIQATLLSDNTQIPDTPKTTIHDAITRIDTAIATAGTVINNAETATEAASKAAQEASRVNISAEQTMTGADITVTDREGTATTVHIDTLSAINTWSDVRNAVRLGLGPTLFPVGYEFTTFDSATNRDITWVVRAHDHHTAANARLTHTMTIEMKNVYSLASGAGMGVQFDSAEALYYAADGLAAGTYNFTLLADYDVEYGGGKTLSFTLTNPVPAGGVIMFVWLYHKQSTDTDIKIYASNTSTSSIDTVPVTEGADGTALGTADGAGALNHTHRIRYGSNNYAQSAVRQWLNSDAAAGAVWAPQTKFDRPPSWVTTYNGFMHGLPADFLAVVQPAVIPCRTNLKRETNSLDGTAYTPKQVYTISDKFFLLSYPEIYGVWDSTTYKDGELLDYYKVLTNTERIKYDAAGSARAAFSRSPDPVYLYNVRGIITNGNIGSYYTSVDNAVAPACIIA